MSQHAFSDHLQVDQATVSRWERGVTIPGYEARQLLDEWAHKAGLATLGRLAIACKNKVAKKYKVSQAEADVQVAATLQESLDSGAMGLKDLREYGASYNWSVASNNASGSCDLDAKGKITQFTGK